MLTSNCFTDWCPDMFGRNLKSLSLYRAGDGKESESRIRLLNALQMSPALQRLHLSSVCFASIDEASDVFAALSRSPALRHVQLKWAHISPGSPKEQFCLYEECVHLEDQARSFSFLDDVWEATDLPKDLQNWAQWVHSHGS